MKIVKIVIIALVVLVAVVIVTGLTAPKEYSVSRSISIDAPVASVYEQAYYFSNFNNWSPWYEMDTNQVIRIEGKDGEVGSMMYWSSEKEEVGKGHLERKVVEENKLITDELTFEGFDMKADDSMTFEEKDGKTVVTWTNSGKLDFMTSLFFLFNDADKMMGPDFERGLENLKAYVESHPSVNVSTEMVIETTNYGPNNIISIREKTTVDNFKATYDKLQDELKAFAKEKGLEIHGNPFAFYHQWEPPQVDIEVGLAVDKLTDKTERVASYESNLGEVVVGHYIGGYDGFEPAHEKINEWIASNGKTSNGSPVEVYFVGPDNEPDQSKWKTDIIYPVK